MSLRRILKLKKNFPILAADDSVMDAIRQMIALESGVVLVADKGHHLIGLLSERDVMTNVTAKKLDPEKTRLRDVMFTDIIKLTESATASDAIQTMVNGRIRHLPVVTDENEIVGLISLRYLLHDRIRELAEELDGLEAYLNDAPGG
jgi:CBS domain-containing protein